MLVRRHLDERLERARIWRARERGRVRVPLHARKLGAVVADRRRILAVVRDLEEEIFHRLVGQVGGEHVSAEGFGSGGLRTRVGFFRPHTPYVAPKRYHDLYPLDRIHLPPTPPGDRDDIPPIAFAHNNATPHYGLDELTCRRALQAYYASVSFVDAQVGRLLDALDRLQLSDQTLVVLWSDHGYHLGEHGGIWQKRTLFEQSAGAPLLIRKPGAAGNGVACPAIVEFVDIYPTIAETCGLTPPPALSGRSLAPLLANPGQSWPHAAFTQILRPGDGRPVMGRTVRTDRWRYTEWYGGDTGAELYDHTADPGEFTNLAADPGHADSRRVLRQLFEGNARAGVPETPFEPKRL